MVVDVDARPPDLLELTAAWQTIFMRDLRDDALSHGVRGFARDAEARLARLAEQLRDGSWQPGRLTHVALPKDDGEIRHLQVPTVSDRIVETALLASVVAAIEPHLAPGCVAYRPGLGVADAVHQVTGLREAGLRWVLRTDVHDCFPSIDRDAVRAKLAPLVPAPIWAIIDAMLERAVWQEHGRAAIPSRGIAQGSPLSPPIANLVLTELDDALADHGFRFVRYADDVAVCCATRQDAQHARTVVRDTLERMGMQPGEDDTEVMSFEDGFAFLGEEFGPRYPPHVTGFKVQPPLERTMFVARAGCQVSVAEGQLRVHADDVEILSVPTGHVARVVLFGPAGFSAGARSWALANGVDVIFCSQRGNYLGQLSTPASRVERRLRQADLRHDQTWRVRVGAGSIASKLRHQVTLLRRFATPATAEPLAQAVSSIRRLLEMLPDAVTTEEVMGLEGAAARSYFDNWPQLLPEDLTFSGRNRHPPLDALNSALSWSYTVLHGETAAALTSAGLDPAIGILHESRDRQFSLANDLMEEFRPLIVDAAIFALARAGDLRDDHGRHEGDGVLLTAEGRRRVAGAYENRMITLANGAKADFRGSYRRLLHEQASQLAAIVDGRSEQWTGLSWR